MRATTYAQALRELLAAAPKSEHDGLIERFAATVRRNGHAHLFPAIVRTLERLAQRHAREATLEIVTAEKITHDEREKILAAHSAPKDRVVAERVDPSLVGGYVLRSRSQRIDASYKRTLFELYQRIVNN